MSSTSPITKLTSPTPMKNSNSVIVRSSTIRTSGLDFPRGGFGSRPSEKHEARRDYRKRERPCERLSSRSLSPVGGATHDHFEWHPNNPTQWGPLHVSPYGVSMVGTAIDPYPFLNAVC